MLYTIVSTRIFRRQYRQVIKQGKDRHKIDGIINRLARRETMPTQCRVHKLRGKYEGFFEMHIEPDLLLVYAYEDRLLVLDLISIGSHSKLFG